MAALDPRKRRALLLLLLLLLSDTPALPLPLHGNSPQSDPTITPLMAAAVASQTTEKPHSEQGGGRISLEYLEGLREAECIWQFRFTVDKLQMLCDTLQLPHPLITKHGYHAPAIECLSLLCARLRSPKDQWSLATKYARPQSAISEIVSKTATYIDAQWGHLLLWDNQGILLPDALHKYTKTLYAFGAPTRSIFGFLDCTICQMCRPGFFQELVFMGYKKYHGMKFQGVMLPNGLIAHLAGPYRVPQNDAGLLNESGLIDLIVMQAIQPGSHDGNAPKRCFFQVYGDSVYSVSPYMVSPFSGLGELMQEERAWNTAMGKVRILVEHGFGLVLQDWLYLDAFWKHQVLGNACGLMYRIGVLLTNAHTCVLPNQTSQCYNLPPLTLSEYFHD